MLGERLQLARKAAGVSLREAAVAAEMSHTAVSKWEKEELTPSSSQLMKLARAYNVRTEYFFRPRTVMLGNVEYRKQSSVPKKLLNRVQGDVREQAERWQDLIALFPEPVIKAFTVPESVPQSIQTTDQLEYGAQAVREAWGVGYDAIHDLIGLLESRGILVIRTDVDETGKVDGLSGRIDHLHFVVVSAHRPGDRQRLTLAHELAHLVLEGRITPSLRDEVAGSKSAERADEDICHRFAGAFLLPRPAIVQVLGDSRQRLEMRELQLLKQEFGLSMQACIYRARNAGIIDQNLLSRLFATFSREGWRKQEPGDAYPAESTVLFEQLVYRALGQALIGESKAAELLKMPLATFYQQRMLGTRSASTG